MAVLFQGQLNIGDKCLDHQGNQWVIPILATPNGSPSQQWTLYDNTDFNLLVADSLGWMALRTDNLLISPAWKDPSSPQHWFLRPDGQLQAEQGPLVLRPTADGASVMTTDLIGWTFTIPVLADFAPAGYILVAQDEFTAPNLDTTKWWTRGSYNGGTQQFMNAGEVGRYNENGNHIMTGDTVKLMALPVGSAGAGLYATGAIRSKFTIPLASGDGYYIAVRCKVPNGRGIHVAAWLTCDDRSPLTPSWPPELGAMEVLVNATYDGSGNRTSGQDTEVIGLDIQTNGSGLYNANVISDQSANFNTTFNIWFADFLADQDFHVYGLWYKNGNFAQTIDGRPISHGTYNWIYQDNTPANPANIICNFDLGGPVAGTQGIDKSKFPQAYEIDFVRVYQEPGTSSHLGVSTVGVDLMPPTGG